MAIALVQSTLGGNATATATTFVGMTTTTSGTFLTNTTPTNLLVLVAWARSFSYQAQALPAAPVPTTSGLTWVSRGSSISQQVSPNDWASGCFVYLATNAAGVASTTPTQLVGTTSAAPTSITATLVSEFSLYEFSGALGRDAALASSSNTGGTPTCSGLSTSTGDLIMMTFQGINPSNVGYGSGYATGVAATAATVGQTQYKLAATGGLVTVAFGSAVASNYAAVAISILQSTAVAAAFTHSFPVLIF